MAGSEEEQTLSTVGSGTSPLTARRLGNTVLKEAGLWSDAVIGLLRNLESVGFGGAPRMVGNGYAPDGRMTVTFVPGPGAVWRESWLRSVGNGARVFGHGDAAPWNIVGAALTPSALIDWDFAGPVDQLTDLAYAVWLNAQRHDDDVAAHHGLPDAVARARHAHRIMDGYGLPSHRRAQLVERMIDVAVQGARAEAIMGRVTPDSTGAVSPEGSPVLWAITWRARSASWTLRHRLLLSAPG